MYRELIEIIRCPKCNENLSLCIDKEEDNEISEGVLCCKNGHIWHIREGVVDFESKEQESANHWSESYKECDYEELDKTILEGTPENQKIINSEAKDFIVDNLTSSRNKFILDIATGRGMLANEVIKRMKDESQLICTDLSFEVLKYDRIKAKKINPELKVNYIACNGANLPFKDSSIDIAASFYGIANMLAAAFEGIKEAARVLKPGHEFYDAFIVIKEDSAGYELVKEFFKENNAAGSEKFSLLEEIKQSHTKAGFSENTIVTIGESIGEKCDFDIIPYEGEWFAVIVDRCIK